MRVGFIGLGSQGGPMARAIVDAGFETTLWARRPASLEPYADTAAKIAESPAELGAASDLVCLCVVGDADVEEVLGGDTGVLAGMADGGIIAIHSTVHPDTCRKLAETASGQRCFGDRCSSQRRCARGGREASAGHGRRRRGRRRALPPGLRDATPTRSSISGALGSGQVDQAAEQPAVHRQRWRTPRPRWSSGKPSGSARPVSATSSLAAPGTARR